MNSGKGGTPRVLHCHSAFPAGQAAQFSLELAGALGEELDHSFASAAGLEGARPQFAACVSAELLRDFPTFGGRPGPGRLVSLARAMAGYDLILTYGWGAMNAVMAHRVFGQTFALPPLIHHEIAFGEGGATEFSPRRNWYRRIALGSARNVVLETGDLARAATKVWHVPNSRIEQIARGIDLHQFGKRRAAPDALPGLIKRDGEMWLGVMATSTAQAELITLVDAMVSLPDKWHLVILGEPASRDAIGQAADRAAISHRVHLPGKVSDVPIALALLDGFAACASHFDYPLETVEAMAAGLPIVAQRRSASGEILPAENAEFLSASGSETDMAAALIRLAANEQASAAAGTANRACALKFHDRATAIANYRQLYLDALGRAL